MSGSTGDGDGFVYLAHAWVPDEGRAVTTGPWHWWNVYRTEAAATGQAAQTALSWGAAGAARWEVKIIEGRRH